MIGNTPLIKIKYKYKNKINYIYVKLEYYNLTGSIKDRMVKYILDKAIENKKLKPNMPIIEATSGNTGISLAAFGALNNHPVHIFIPKWLSKERIKLLKMYGAHVYKVSKKDGGFKKSIELADSLAIKLNGYRPNQFNNIDNINAHYYGIGSEIVKTIPNIGAFISGIGTGGTLMGIGLKLKENFKNIKTIGIEPKQYAIISGNITSDGHKIEGIGDDFIPKIVDKNLIDSIILIDDNDAINMAKIIAKKLGLGVGISSGANLLGAILTKEKIRKNVVTLFPDDNKKYISTMLANEIDDDINLISNNIELIDYRLI